MKLWVFYLPYRNIAFHIRPAYMVHWNRWYIETLIKTLIDVTIIQIIVIIKKPDSVKKFIITWKFKYQ